MAVRSAGRMAVPRAHAVAYQQAVKSHIGAAASHSERALPCVCGTHTHRTRASVHASDAAHTVFTARGAQFRYEDERDIFCLIGAAGKCLQESTSALLY
eukprot:2158515-Prymnesium_polylepis.2